MGHPRSEELKYILDKLCSKGCEALLRALKSFLLQVMLLVGLSPLSRADDTKPYSTQGYAGCALRSNVVGRSYWDVGADFFYRRPIGNGHWWVSQRVAGVSGVSRDGSALFSFQGALDYGSWLLARVVQGKRMTNFEACSSPVFIALNIPSTQIDLSLSDYCFIGLGNNTEYLFFRGHTGNKGIAYTPSLSFSVWGYPRIESFEACGVQLQIGHAFFWNFEGASEREGWIVGVTLLAGYDT